ncbi:MAG: hypothetical protein U0838_01025 [Chloroflexota bacterium]
MTRARLIAVAVGLVLAGAAFAVYWISNENHYNQYVHFVWQADAFLHGRPWFEYPVQDGVNTVTGQPVPGVPDNYYYQDVYPLKDAAGEDLGRVLLPFPPLPAIVLMPFVAVFGLFVDQEAVAIGLGALGVLSTWWMLGGLRPRLSVRILVTLIFATGTTWWWAAAAGTTWYLAHLVALNLAMLAVGITLRHDPRAALEPWHADHLPDEAYDRGFLGRLWAAAWPLDRSQVLAGLLLGLSVTARLPLVFAAPWFIFVGGGGTRLRRTVSTGVGAFLPVALLLGYTFATTGSFMHPGYDYQYQLEAWGYPTLGYNPDYSVEDVRYIPHNLGVMFGSLPVVAPDLKPNTLGFGDPVFLCQAPDAKRGLFDQECPLLMPVDVGTSILLSAPGLLLALLAFRRPRLARLKVGATAAVVIIALFNLSHFSQGWVQWGYRFSLDFMPFLLPLVAIGAAKADGKPRLLAIALVVIGAAVNVWGVTWGQMLGW